MAMHPEDLQHPREAGPLLTLVACARNDQHEGDSVWRLETTLNFAAESVVRTIGRRGPAGRQRLLGGTCQQCRDPTRCGPICGTD